MSDYVLSSSLTLETIECGGCGIVFAVPQQWKKNKVASNGSFSCPNGCSRHFIGETEAQKYKRLLEQEQRTGASYRENLVAAQRAKDRAEKSLQRLKKRTAAGVCPCCNRTVSQLAQHMHSKHKEFLELNGLAPRKQLSAPENIQ